MGSIGPAEILVVLVVALIVLGPNRLPDAARSLGKALAEVRRVTSGMQAEVRDAFAEAPTYPTPASSPAPDGASTHAPPSSPEHSEVAVVREPDPPPSA
ncbi:MAG TPA: twin-arginine translocase TatA/TatE family subunit [Acidimicrobiales bacterium]|nr:twin-arginine translocase TatA/TatE family subunit [Acidimicrobiales bacterium]